MYERGISINGQENVSRTTSTSGNIVSIIKSNAQGFAIDGKNGSENAQSVYLWTADSTNVNQQWIEIDRGSSYYSYQKMGTEHCLDGGASGATGQDVYLWQCGDNNQNQHWLKESMGDGTYKLTKRNAQGFAIDGGSGGSTVRTLSI